MINAKPMLNKIIQVYLLGATALLMFYCAILNHSILYAENQNSERRLALVAPYHFALFNQDSASIIKINPMLKIYDQYDILPTLIKRRLHKEWQGSINFHFEDDSEFGVFAQKIMTSKGQRIVYAVENIDAIEWDDVSFAIFQLIIFGLGLLIFIISVLVSIKMARRISMPFTNLAIQLENNKNESYAPLTVEGEPSLEIMQTLKGVNSYRSRIQDAFIREKAFTRYISHELRTPMTVIRGAVSVLRLLKNEKSNKQCNRIDMAVIEMEHLIHTFLLLARDEDLSGLNSFISKEYIRNLIIDIEPTIKANQVEFHQQLQCEFNIAAQSLLFSAVIKNLLKNAINCSIAGNVDLFISPERIDVIDNGVGLDAKPRGYEGFGIGLNIVRDICEKYHWQFSIKNNESKGCTASVIFKKSS